MIIAIDLGTSGVRVTAVDRGYEPMATHRTRIALRSSAGGRHECSLAEVEAAVYLGIRAVMEMAIEAVDAVSFCSQGEVVFALGPNGEAPSTFAVTMDNTGQPAVAAWQESGRSAAEFSAVTGQPLHPMFPIFRFQAGSVESLGDGGLVCSLDSYLRWRLGGNPAMDYSLAARSGFFDVRTLSWSRDHCEWAGLDVAQFVPAQAPGTRAGSVNRAGRELSGLPEGTPIVVGSHDQAAAFWGAGGAPKSRPVFSAGSSECLTQATARRPGDLGVPLPSYPVGDEFWLTLIGSPAGGWSMEWLAGFAGGRDIGELVREAAALDATSVITHPYFSGGSTFRNDPTLTGTVGGLTLATTPAEVARALIEASGFEVHDAIRHTSAEMGVPPVVVATGSGSTPETTQIRADASGIEFLMVTPDAATRGTALQARVALGDVEALIPTDPPAGVPVHPRPDRAMTLRREAYLRTIL